ncbi:MAG: hypothetical protein ACRDPM_02605 [Solirubrobacteraceae bacterium]
MVSSGLRQTGTGLGLRSTGFGPARGGVHPGAPANNVTDGVSARPAAALTPASSSLAGSRGTPEHVVRGRRITSASPLPSSSVPLPDTAASAGGGSAAGGGLGSFFFSGIAALLALAVVVVPGVIWALAATARLAPTPPSLSLLERPG